MGVMRDWPPEYSLDDQGEPTGFAVDIMDAVAERAGLEVTYRVYDRWSDLLLGRGPRSHCTSTRGLEAFEAALTLVMPIHADRSPCGGRHRGIRYRSTISSSAQLASTSST